MLFHIGMRINRLRALRTWVPVLVAMPRMLRELSTHPELGLLSFEVFGRAAPSWSRRGRGVPRNLPHLDPDSETVSVEVPVIGLPRATGHVPVARCRQAAAHCIDPATPGAPAVTPAEVHP